MATTMQSTRSTRRWRGLAAASLLVVAPLSLAACGGSSSASTSTAKAGNSSGTGNQASAADMQAYRECLAKNGVSMPTPPADGEASPSGQSEQTPPSMPDQSTMQAAQKACADLAPAGGMNPGGAPGAGGQEMQAYTQCLTEKGVTLPDRSQSGAPPANPGSNEAGATQPSDRGPFGLDTSDPTVKAAVAACADVAPKMPSGGAPSGGAPSGGAPSGGAQSGGAPSTSTSS